MSPGEIFRRGKPMRVLQAFFASSSRKTPSDILFYEGDIIIFLERPTFHGREAPEFAYTVPCMMRGRIINLGWMIGSGLDNHPEWFFEPVSRV